jgi:prephenate dehydratase
VISPDKKVRVAFQGERGAFSEQAAICMLGPKIELVPQRTFADLFCSIENESADLIVAPVENSISGVVEPSVELLNRSKLKTLGEVSILVAQQLIGCPGSSLTELKSVQSHPVALAQCQRFLSSHPQLKAIEAHDTAGSVAEIIKAADRQCAAIAGRLAAELYGGVILRENIQDLAENYTHFLLLGPAQALARTQQIQLEKEYKS